MSNRRKSRGRTAAPHGPLKSGVYILEVRHDDGCPTLRTHRSSDCTCTQVDQVFKRIDGPGVRR